MTKQEQIVQIEKQAIADALQGQLDKYLDGGISPKHFSKFKPEWEWIIESDRQYGKSPTIDTFQYQFSALELPARIDASELIIEQLSKEYIFNTIAPGVNDLVKAMRDGQTVDGLDKFISLVQLTTPKCGVNRVNLYSEATSRLQNYEETINNQRSAISYGYTEWDRITGGIKKTDLVVVAGMTGVGKSLIGLEIAKCVANQGYNVDYFNGEMDDYELGYRLDTLESHISNFAISNGKIGKEGQILENYRIAAGNISQKNIGLYAFSKDGLSDIKITPTFLGKYIMQNKTDMLVLDQFSLIDSTAKKRETSEINFETVRELRVLAKQLKVPIILLAQIKRQDKKFVKQIKDDEPRFDTSDLSQTRGLEQFATVLVMLDQPYMNEELLKEFNNRKLLHMYFAKNRGGDRDHILTYAMDIDKGERTYIKSNKPLPDYGDNKQQYRQVPIFNRKGEGEIDEGDLPF